MPDLDLTDWQYDLGGVLIGAGTQVNVIETAGLGRPPVRDNDVDQPSMDGQWAGPDYWSGRQVQIDAAIKIPGEPDACHDMIAALQAASDTAAVRLVGGQGMTLRIEANARFVLQWTRGGGAPTQKCESVDTTIGVWVADLAAELLPAGSDVQFTFYWPDADRWEGTSYSVSVGAT